MGYVVLIILIIILFAIRSSSLDFISKRFLLCYTGAWTIATFFCTFNFINLHSLSDRSYFIILTHLLFFVAGYKIIKIRNIEKHKFSKDNLLTKVGYISDNLFFKVVLLIITAYVLSLLVKFYGMISAANVMGDVRADFFDPEKNIYGDSFRSLNQWILKPFSYIAALLFSVLCVYKRNFICVVLGIFLFSYESLGGGRFGYVRIALIFVFVLFCLFPLKLNKKKILSVILGFLIVYELILLVTVARINSISDFQTMQKEGSEMMFETTILSLTQPIVSFDYALDHNYVERTGGYQFGTLTLTSIHRIINPFLAKIGVKTEIATSQIAFKQNEYIDIGYIRPQNALYTSLLWYYLDLGLFGIAFFPFIFGIVTRYIIKQLYQFKSVPLLVVLSVIFYFSIFTLFDHQFTTESQFLMLLLLMIAGCKPKLYRIQVIKYLAIYLFLAFFFTIF